MDPITKKPKMTAEDEKDVIPLRKELDNDQRKGKSTNTKKKETLPEGCPLTWKHFNADHKIIKSKASNNNNDIRESFSYDVPAASGSPLVVPLPESSPTESDSSSQLLSPSSLTDAESSRSCSSGEDYDEEIYDHIKKLTHLKEAQLSCIQDMCTQIDNFVKRQEQTDLALLEVFKKLAEKTDLNKPT